MPKNPIPRRIGVISDTHGHLESAAIEILKGVDLILHAGDIDDPRILRQLEQIAPVTAVQGNMDRGAWSRNLRPTELIPLGNTWIYMMHDCGGLDLDPRSAGIHMVIHGHTHRAVVESRDGVTYLNPGSATLPRDRSRPTLARIRLDADGGNPQIEIIELNSSSPEL